VSYCMYYYVFKGEIKTCFDSGSHVKDDSIQLLILHGEGNYYTGERLSGDF